MARMAPSFSSFRVWSMASARWASTRSRSHSSTQGPQSGQAFGWAWNRRSPGSWYSRSQAGHWRNSDMVVWGRVFAFAGWALAKLGHGGVGPVVRNLLDDGVARSAVGAIGEGVPIAAVGGVAQGGQAVRAGGDVRRNEHELDRKSTR